MLEPDPKFFIRISKKFLSFRWIELGLNWLLLVLITCVAIVGPGMFGKFILLFLLVVVVCTLTVMWSFFGFFTTRSYVLTFNETTVANCTANCTYEVVLIGIDVLRS